MTKPADGPHAYVRIAQALTKAERRAWNRQRDELYLLAERLRDDVRFGSEPSHYPAKRAARLVGLVAALPFLHHDGKGASWGSDRAGLHSNGRRPRGRS